MIVKKSEATSRLTETQLRVVKLIEEKINEELREGYSGETIVVYLGDRFLDPKVQKEIEKRCKKAGWKVALGENQRDGWWIELS